MQKPEISTTLDDQRILKRETFLAVCSGAENRSGIGKTSEIRTRRGAQAR
jgi:hypothetical protein